MMISYKQYPIILPQRIQGDPRPDNQGYIHSCSSGSADSCTNQHIHDRGSNPAVYRQPGLYSYAGYPADHCDACMSCSSDCSSLYADGINKSHYSKVMPRYCGTFSQGRPPSYPQTTPTMATPRPPCVATPTMATPRPPCVEHSQDECGLCSSANISLHDGCYGDTSRQHPGGQEYPCGDQFNTISGYCYGNNINNSSGYHSLMSPTPEGSVCACAGPHDGVRVIPNYNINVQPSADNHNQQYSSRSIYPAYQLHHNISPSLDYGNNYQHQTHCDEFPQNYNIPSHLHTNIPPNTQHLNIENSSSNTSCESDFGRKENCDNNYSQEEQDNVHPDIILKDNSSLALKGYVIPPMKNNHRDSSDYEQIDDLSSSHNLNGKLD